MKWKAPATEPSPDCRPLHEVHATAKDDQGHAWSNGEYAARGRNGRDYAWACHPLPAPQPEMTRTRVFSRLLHKRTMNMMPPCGGEFRHWQPSYPATGIWSTTPPLFRQWAGPPRPHDRSPGLEKIFLFPLLRQRFRPALPVPKAGRESCGQQTRLKSLHATCGTSSPAAPHQATSASHAAQTRGIPPVPLPSRPCLSHLAYWRHRHDAGTKPSGGYE